MPFLTKIPLNNLTKKMSTCFSLEIESKSIDLDINTNPVSSQKNNKKNFLTKKRFQKKEHNLKKKEFDEPKEDYIFENMKELDDYIKNFPTFPESNILNEDEKSFESDECYFIKKPKEGKNLLKTYYPGNYLFTRAKEDLLKSFLNGIDFSIKTRSSGRLPNYKQKHYIRVNIKRTFMNKYLVKALNKLLKKYEFITLFSKFPQSLAINVSKDLNKVLMNMRLKESFRSKVLYEDVGNANYKHNLKIVDEIEKKGNPELKMILNRKVRCLFEEYLNSEEFGKHELMRLKKLKKKKDEYYVKKYIYLAKQFIDFVFNRSE